MLISLVLNNKVAAKVRAFLVDYLQKDMERKMPSVRVEITRRKAEEKAQGLLKDNTKENFSALVELAGKKFATIDMGREFK